MLAGTIPHAINLKYIGVILVNDFILCNVLTSFEIHCESSLPVEGGFVVGAAVVGAGGAFVGWPGGALVALVGGCAVVGPEVAEIDKR